MQRQHPFLSPTGISVTAVALGILAIFYWQTGGLMFNPGPLAAAHTEIDDCVDCHQPLSTNQGALCMECHTEIKEEINTNNGLHARFTEPESCLGCHPDHRGFDFDLRESALQQFDHNLTTFSLIRHTLDYEASAIDCQDCHAPGGFNVDMMGCVECHGAVEPEFIEKHTDDFGLQCLECHDGVDRMVNFDHSQTDFPLEDGHEATTCADCHNQGQFTETEIACSACHAEPARHAGLFQAACEDCHTPSGWAPARFNGQSFEHFRETGFSLARHQTNFDASVLNCVSCHVESLESFDSLTCEQCHIAEDAEYMVQHGAEFGPGCLECHDGLDSMQAFDHSAIFVLDGAHEPLVCTSCHIDHNFAGTSAACSDCHAEPELHVGIFGLNCANCHTTSAWHPAALSQHSFPLNHGGEGEIACATCHPTTFVQFTCDRCHEAAEMIEEHNDEDIFGIAGRCLECHQTGLTDEQDD